MAESERLIRECFESVKATFEDDTESTLKQMEILRQLNTSTTLKYIKKEEDFKTLSRKAEHIHVMNNQIQDYKRTLTSMETRLDFIEKLTDELDEFTKDLDKSAHN